MLRVEQIEARFKEIRYLITTIPESQNKRAYVKHLESLRESLNKEYLKALERESEQGVIPMVEPEVYSYSNPRTGRSRRMI